MSNTPSNMLPLGTIAPDFELLNTVSNKKEKLQEWQGKQGTVVLFISNHCPFVIHINTEIVKMANAYHQKGIQFIAISSNDASNYPQDAPHLMKELAEKENYSFPYLYDETQQVAKAYNAACTPDIYLFDARLKLVYRGQIDSSRPGNGIPVTGIDLRSAMDSVLVGKPISANQKPSIGCNIKWLP